MLELPAGDPRRAPPGLAPPRSTRPSGARTQEGKAIYELDEDAARTELEPDLIVTQALCAVCAVSYDDVVEVAEAHRAGAAA